MKIREYPQTYQVDVTDDFLVETDAGTRRIKANNLKTALNGSMDAVAEHRNIFRGKNLGTSYTAEQKAAIASGTFDDIYVGDYWEMGGQKWRVADIDLWMGKVKDSSGAVITEHHIAIVPDAGLYTNVYNSTADNSGGFYNSKIWNGGLDKAKTTISSLFGSSNIVIRRAGLVSAKSSTTGAPSAITNVDYSVGLMTDKMVFGYAPFSYNTLAVYRTANDSGGSMIRLALFDLHPGFIQSSNGPYWLADVGWGSDSINAVNKTGGAANIAANDSTAYVRPIFGLYG